MSENTIFGARFFIYDEIFQALFNFDEEKYGSIGIPFVAGDSFCIYNITLEIAYFIINPGACRFIPKNFCLYVKYSFTVFVTC